MSETTTRQDLSRRKLIQLSVAAAGGLTVLGGGGAVIELVDDTASTAARTWSVLADLAKAVGLGVLSDAVVRKRRQRLDS